MENPDGYSTEFYNGSKILSKSLYLVHFSRYKHFCVLQIFEKSENSKWPPFLATQKFLGENRDGNSAQVPCRSKISLKSLYLARFLGYKHFFSIFAKNLKIQNGRHFGMATQQRYPMGLKIHQKRSNMVFEI